MRQTIICGQVLQSSVRIQTRHKNVLLMLIRIQERLKAKVRAKIIVKFNRIRKKFTQLRTGNSIAKKEWLLVSLKLGTTDVKTMVRA